MNMKRMLALVLALTMVFALAACGGNGDTTGGASGTTAAPTGEVTYSVTVSDILGNPCTENIIVLFLQDGQQVAMQPVNAEGVATKVLPGGDYQIQLQITQNAESYHYAADLQVSAANPNLTLILSAVAGEEYDVLSVNGMERTLYKLNFTPADASGETGTFVLEDLNGNLDGTYCYAVNDEGGFDITDESGAVVDMAIILALDGSYAFYCEGMNFAQPMRPEGDATAMPNGAYQVASNEYVAPHVMSGCTWLELNGGERNYVIFTPQQSGIFEITLHNATGSVGYYGSPYFVSSENSGTPGENQSITVEIKDSMIGTNGTGTTQLVIGLDVAQGVENGIISVVRISDYERTPEEMPWQIYESTYTPSKYSLPAGMTIHEFDLTASTDTYNLVYNEADGFYHLGSADGAVVLVRLNESLAYGGCFGDMLAGINVGVYFYGEDGTFLRKELYNDCLLQYLGTLNKGMGTHSYEGGMLDDTYGVYPLTNDLMYIITSYGEYAGWWDNAAANYLFADLPQVNTEIAWLFMCCFAQ